MRLRSCLLVLLILLGSAPPQAHAGGDYPKRQIRIIVPFPPGAGTDQVARRRGQHLQDAFAHAVLIENRAGALGSIAPLEIARGAPDGYTAKVGIIVTALVPAGFVAFVQDEIVRWTADVKAAGIEPNRLADKHS
jgi:tripartite-type tricarboxylate transporter receptor subunit TctC